MSGRLSVGTRRRVNVRKLALLPTMTTAMKMIVVPSVTIVRLPPSALARMSSSSTRMLATSESTSSGASIGMPSDSAHAWNDARSPVSSSTIDGPPSMTSAMESANESATRPVAIMAIPATAMNVRAAASPRGSQGKWLTSHFTIGSRRKASSQPRKNMIAICRNGGHMSRIERHGHEREDDRKQIERRGDRAPLARAEVETVDHGPLSRAMGDRMIGGPMAPRPSL